MTEYLQKESRLSDVNGGSSDGLQGFLWMEGGGSETFLGVTERFMRFQRAFRGIHRLSGELHGCSAAFQ